MCSCIHTHYILYSIAGIRKNVKENRRKASLLRKSENAPGQGSIFSIAAGISEKACTAGASGTDPKP